MDLYYNGNEEYNSSNFTYYIIYNDFLNIIYSCIYFNRDE